MTCICERKIFSDFGYDVFAPGILRTRYLVEFSINFGISYGYRRGIKRHSYKTSKNVLLTTIEDADIDPVYFARDARAIPFKRGMKRLSLADKGMMMGLGKRGMIGDRGR